MMYFCQVSGSGAGERCLYQTTEPTALREHLTLQHAWPSTQRAAPAYWPEFDGEQLRRLRFVRWARLDGYCFASEDTVRDDVPVLSRGLA
jgi:hypothetical protein